MTNTMDQISLSDYSNLCRLCGSKINVSEGLLIFEEGEAALKQIYKKIAECLPIHVGVKIFSANAFFRS